MLLVGFNICSYTANFGVIVFFCVASISIYFDDWQLCASVVVLPELEFNYFHIKLLFF
uniref:Uncharacterized protein n=1 Tax=Papilio xuthus TaxID=66420 RepID=I4DLP1_PAPXU|nr:unknown unsecreted protein [Papilio xuthus]